MTLVEAFKNGQWVHSAGVLGVDPDANFYRTGPGGYAFSAVTAGYTGVDRGLEIGVGVAPAAFAGPADTPGLTVTVRTQSGGVDAGANPNGGDLIFQRGLSGGGTGRAGSFSFPGPAAGALQNECIGLGSGGKQTIGFGNTLFGAYSGAEITTGFGNVAIGDNALSLSQTSESNVAVGSYSLSANNITGLENVGVGGIALFNLSTGNQNIAVGHGCLSALTTGSNNTAVGWSAGGFAPVMTGSGNVLVGHQAGASLSSGTSNVLVGITAGINATTAVGATIVGALAGQSHNAGTAVIVGYSAGISATGSNLVLVGYNSGLLVTGADNTFVGQNAGMGVTSGAANTLLGKGAGVINGGGLGVTLTTGSSNTCVGYEANTSAAATTHSVAIGYRATSASGIAIGSTALNQAADGITIGTGAFSANVSLCIGRSATTTAANQAIFGSDTVAYTNVFFGKGAVSATPVAYAIKGTGGSGNNVAGADIRVAGGIGTGTGLSGSLVLQTAGIENAAAATPNILRDRLVLSTVNNANLGSDLSFAAQTTQLAAMTLLSITEEVTILAAATTSSTLNLLPANSFVVGITCRVTTVIPGGLTWQAGTAITASLFVAALTSGAAGTTATSFAHAVTSLAPFINQAAAPIVITPSGVPGAATGKIRITVFYYTLTAPGS